MATTYRLYENGTVVHEDDFWEYDINPEYIQYTYTTETVSEQLEGYLINCRG